MSDNRTDTEMIIDILEKIRESHVNMIHELIAVRVVIESLVEQMSQKPVYHVGPDTIHQDH